MVIYVSVKLVKWCSPWHLYLLGYTLGLIPSTHITMVIWKCKAKVDIGFSCKQWYDNMQSVPKMSGIIDVPTIALWMHTLDMCHWLLAPPKPSVKAFVACFDYGSYLCQWWSLVMTIQKTSKYRIMNVLLTLPVKTSIKHYHP